MTGLSKRERAILSAVVTEFTATGEPVASRTLARKYDFDLSPATIRNVLADLEDQGYLSQPHASAGRVPTEAAFRLFIDALLRLQRLSPDDASRITGAVAGVPPGAEMLRSAGRVLSDMTGVAAILVRTPVPERTLATLRFIRTFPGELLGVMVLSDGSVENRFIQVEAGPSEQELERLHNMLEGVVTGRTLADIRDYFVRKVSEQRDEVRALQQVGVLLLEAAIDAAGARPEVIIEGQTRLFARPEFDTAEMLRDVVRVLEEREQLVSLLNHIIETDRVQVFLGKETAQKTGVGVSLVAAPYQSLGRPGGAVGVIGPIAMDFSSIIPLVSATADAMSLALARSRS